MESFPLKICLLNSLLISELGYRVIEEINAWFLEYMDKKKLVLCFFYA